MSDQRRRVPIAKLRRGKNLTLVTTQLVRSELVVTDHSAASLVSSILTRSLTLRSDCGAGIASGYVETDDWTDRSGGAAFVTTAFVVVRRGRGQFVRCGISLRRLAADVSVFTHVFKLD